jgi:hypothetical protein
MQALRLSYRHLNIASFYFVSGMWQSETQKSVRGERNTISLPAINVPALAL